MRQLTEIKLELSLMTVSLVSELRLLFSMDSFEMLVILQSGLTTRLSWPIKNIIDSTSSQYVQIRPKHKKRRRKTLAYTHELVKSRNWHFITNDRGRTGRQNASPCKTIQRTDAQLNINFVRRRSVVCVTPIPYTQWCIRRNCFWNRFLSFVVTLFFDFSCPAYTGMVCLYAQATYFVRVKAWRRSHPWARPACRPPSLRCWPFARETGRSASGTDEFRTSVTQPLCNL